jgi:hypothetical protein
VLPPRLVFVLALAALWWPGRLAGIFDGVPFDSGPDAIFLGLILPVLLALVPDVCRDRRVQLVVIALLAWKAFSSFALVQDGLCVRVSAPAADGRVVAVKNWDVRTDWLSPDPACSAIATRSYVEERLFPVWLPFNFPQVESATPAHLVMTGTVGAGGAGEFGARVSPSVEARVRMEAQAIVIDATLTADQNWMLVPTRNAADLFSSVMTTVSPPSTLDLIVRPWAKWITFALVAALLVLAAWRSFAAIREWQVLAWMAASAVAGAMIGARLPERWWHYALLLLFAACALRVPAGWQNIRGAFLLLAPSWLALNIVDTFRDQGFGRMDFISPGNDYWWFQLAAYRIYMEGFWLQGGEPAFWYQPFYRWIAGALHLLFGQSQVGENYWDAIGVLVIALFCFDVVRRVWGFRWGIAAGVLALAAFVSGPGYIFIGRGLSEISSAALIYFAALIVIQARERKSVRLVLMAGVFAVLGVWTRLNNMPAALGIAVFAWPLAEPAATLWKPKAWFSNAWIPPLVVIPAAIAFGMFLFALRTWYYTGVFSVFHGTQAGSLAVWRAGMSLDNVVRNMIDSVMMVATTTDPPAYHNGALPIIAGAVLSLAALIGAGWLGRLPLPLVGFTLASFSSALIARGTAYPGRFSIHVVGATVAMATCAMAALAQSSGRIGKNPRRPRGNPGTTG